MPQVKKEDIRLAILEASHALFMEKGYVDTTMVQIAKRAGISHANIYSYFNAKLQVFFCVYDRWFKTRISAVEADVEATQGSHARMRALLSGLLVDTPKLDNGFSHNLMQALASVRPGDAYDPSLLQWFRQRLASMLSACSPSLERDAVRRTRLVDMLVLTFDGCLVNYHVNPTALPDVAMLEEYVRAFLANDPPEVAGSAAPSAVSASGDVMSGQAGSADAA